MDFNTIKNNILVINMTIKKYSRGMGSNNEKFGRGCAMSRKTNKRLVNKVKSHTLTASIPYK